MRISDMITYCQYSETVTLTVNMAEKNKTKFYNKKINNNTICMLPISK